jgi:pimeloyl-ACP methyl ester carboxylesterase
MTIDTNIKQDKAIGRYLYLTVDGIEYRVYYEESGKGIPLLLQHTAGCDGRQYRHVLEDDEITANYRVIAWDLPYHGRSLPPLSVKWWEQDYNLTQDFFMKFVITLADALDCEDAVYMGSSMGGNLAPDLALHYPGKFRAVIVLVAALYSPGYCLDYWFHPEISNDSKPAAMYSLTSPTAPEVGRRETVWVYSQGSPPVFKGDLKYYSVEHDLRETARNIDTSKTAVYILNGEYDFATTPEEGHALADQIDGAKKFDMPGLGHFPMSEDPAQFFRCIKPVLWEIRDAKIPAKELSAAG